MTQAHHSESNIPADRKGWISTLDRMTRNPRILSVALGFAALNAAAAVGVLVMAPQPQAPANAAAPQVTMARLAPAQPRHRVIVGNVVRRLPRAQTWYPPHMLPSGGNMATAPDQPRIAPVALMSPGADSVPRFDKAPATPLPEALTASLPRVVSPQPDPQVKLASLTPEEALTSTPIRPRARPELADIAQQADLNEINQLAVSLRPQVRPEGLLVAKAPSEPRQADATEFTTLAALPRGIDRPVSGATCNTRLTRAIPKRKGSAKGGKAVMAGLMGSGGTTRDSAVVREVLAGNTPSFLRDLVPVEVNGRARDGSRTSIVFCVMPDYLAVGSDRDFIRVPMGMPAASQIAASFDMLLPTRQMVDQIYRAADVRVAPKPMTPGPQMSSTDYLVRHNKTVEGQIRGASVQGQLASGHKKDLVLTNRLNSNRGRVAIYGWHRTNGKAIQPLSTVHGKNYADYSHGVRLISQTAYLNGRPVRLADLFADPTYAELISDEGPIRAAQLQLASAR
ncbi:hypothetical protein [Antarctobacter jejuensis]|uniref:hypothetical protein n=1 Tax=Antarctobacter jejuensis TaxID=1439938 RepID=UPI003FD0C6E6